MEQLDGKTFDIIEDNVSKLKEIFPEVVNGDNQVDFDNLRDILEKDGEVIDDSEEHYNFTWWGKKEAKNIAKQSTTKTLRPVKKDSKNWDNTENIYIEGDNLDVLKILLGSYRNSIKIIYIDPPYNTGNDFIYKDNFAESKEEHLERTGQLSADGFLFENAKTDGRYHSNWLNMIYPRLYLARKLLKEDGVIFISIDDNELENLKKICNEIYGEENFIGINIRKTVSQRAMAKYYNTQHEYCLIYCKNKSSFNLKGDLKNLDNYNNPDNDYNGEWKSVDPTIKGSNNDFEIVNPFTNKVDKPPVGRGWAFSEEKLKELVNQNKLFFRKNHDSNKRGFVLKSYVKDLKSQYLLINSLDECKNDYLNQISTKELNNLFSDPIFDYAKPTIFIERLLSFNKNDDDIILDFFSGSATTAHAVFNDNIKNNKHNKFIMIQIPEETNEKSEAHRKGYKNICEIGKERIRRAGDKILEESENKNLDIGFKVFKVDESNFIPWNPNLNSEEDIKEAIINTENNLVQGRSELDLVYELLLKLNMDLTIPIEEKIMNNHKIYVIDNGYVLICLDSNLDESITDDLLKLKEDLFVEYCQVILRDDALDDNSSINIYENLNSKGVEFRTI